MKTLKVFIISLFVVGVFSCGDEFLNINPKGALDASALASPAGIEASLISAYSMVDGWNGNWGNNGPWAMDAGHWIWSNVASDDAHKGSEASDIPQILSIENYQWLPSNNLLEDLFNTRYEGVARVNATMSLVANSTDLDAARKAQIEGEAKFLRAHYHFDIWRTFKKIPYYTEADTDFRKANDADPIPSMIADLEAAVAVLPVSQSEVGRATKGAAQAILGKVYMHTGNYSAAKTQFDAVVASGQYALATCYHDNFNAATDNSSESIFAVQFSVNDGDPGANNGNYGTRLGMPHSGSPFGCCGFNQPTANLVNSFKTDANGLPITDGTDIDNANDNVDPRLDWTAGRDDVPYYDHGNHERSWIRDPSHGGVYSPKKSQYHADQDQYNSATVAGAWGPTVAAVNYNIIRYADVLLMLAEAEVELGNLEAARALVNEVRNRAGNCAQGSGATSADIQVDPSDASITWANYSVGEYSTAWTDAAAAREAVRLERRLELAMEGHRMYDLRRWGNLETVMSAYFAENAARADSDELKRQHLLSADAPASKHYAFPLPQVQIDLSSVDGTPRLQQNDGF